MAALFLTLLCVVLAFVFGVANGLLVLATIFAGVYAWAAGMFTRLGRGVRRGPEVAGAVDDERDFIQSVEADITSL